MTNLKDAKILIMTTNGFEHSELFTPLDRLRAVGATVDVATPDGKPARSWKTDDWGDLVEADVRIGDASADDYDALVLPGGQINPDILRTDDAAMNLLRSFAKSGRVIGAICHAPWLLVEAGLVEGRDMTSYHSIRTDLENAGANWVDRDVVVSNGIVTSRNPGDLDAFVGKIIEEVEEGRHPRKVA